MSFLKDLVKESAAAGTTAAAAVGVGGGHETTRDLTQGTNLFGGGVVTRGGKKKKMKSIERFDPTSVKAPKQSKGWRVMDSFLQDGNQINEMEGPSDAELADIEARGEVPSPEDMARDTEQHMPKGMKSGIKMVMRAMKNGAKLNDAVEDVVRFFDEKGGAFGYIDPDDLYDAVVKYMRSGRPTFESFLKETMDSNLKGQTPESTFDPSDVLSKLRSAEKQTDTEDDTVPFGLEDEDGKVVKVFVRADQANEFESTLASMLAGEDDDGDNDDETDSTEIAEVLFQLKDKFDIIDVQWPEIEGDEDEEQEVAGGEMGAEGGAPAEGGMGEEGEMGGEGGDLGLEGGEGGEDDLGLGDEEGDDEMDMEAEGGAESTLQQVIDMMKADAEARKAESEARAKEAEARTAEANANAASSKVQQEEQVLDAEAYEKRQKDERGETERLAKIARMKHDQASKAEAKFAAQEDEEELAAMRDYSQSRAENRISVSALADELITRLRGNIR